MCLLKLILNNLVQVDFAKFKARVLKFKLLMFHQFCNILSLKDFSRFSELWALTRRRIISPLKKRRPPSIIDYTTVLPDCTDLFDLFVYS